MKTKKVLSILFLGLIMNALAFQSKAQIPVTDIAGITQSIVNSVQELVQTSSTAANMINTFKETSKIFEQGKAYYDKLKAVHNLVKDAEKVRKTVLMVGEISEIYVTNYQKMLTDKNYSVQELSAMASGYAKLLQEATDALKELKDVVNINGMSMTDKERLDMIDRSYNTVKHFRDLTAYYTRKNISVSYIRSKKAGDTERILQLYGNSQERYW